VTHDRDDSNTYAAGCGLGRGGHCRTPAQRCSPYPLSDCRSFARGDTRFATRRISARAGPFRNFTAANFRTPDIADFRDWNQWPFCAPGCAPIPVRFFLILDRNCLKQRRYLGRACEPKPVRFSPAYERSTRVTAVLTGGVEHRDHQSALQVAEGVIPK
jgi:hypothetical protein